MKKPTKRLFLKSMLLIPVLVLVFVATPIKPAAAQIPADTIGGPVQVVMKVVSQVTKKLDAALKKVGSNMVQTAITNSLKRVAYDTATWIGSGAAGQKAQFATEGTGAYLLSVADSAAGDYIDEFAKNLNVNFCEPDLNVKVKIGLGLVDSVEGGSKIKDSKCKASTMFKAWKSDINEKYKAMTSPTFLKDMSSMFEVGGSDLTASLEVMDGIQKTVYDKKEKEKLDLSIEGWLPNKNIGGKTSEAPGNAKMQLEQATKNTSEAQKVNISQSPVTDAAKVFLNTLATTAFNKALKSLAGGDIKGTLSALTLGIYKDKTDAEVAELIANGGSSSLAANTNGTSCLNDPNCDPNVFQGISAVKSNLAEILKPSFDSRGDYDILSELSVCSDSTKPGPTECILDEQFSSAISDHKTVIEAIKDGSLNKTWRLKRDVDFNQGYSLRSLLVLRKFRIIPVGWETALIKAEENNANVTLMDMVSCFDPNDNYNEFSQGFTPSTWCQGLIDPNWVLKAPLNYCKRQGYGNQILDKTLIAKQTAGSEVIPEEIIMTRADEYCADEQSCIKEKSDGTCEAYGYCTEEKRTWDFDSDSCDAIYNTCQRFIKTNGASVSYLENTIDYSTCNVDNAGCRPYAVSGSYDGSSDKITWNSSNHIYFSKKAEACDSSQEGCNELIRIIPEAGHNFLVNSDFEQDLNIGSWNTNIDINNSSSTNSVSTVVDGYFSDTSISVGGILKKNVVVGPNDYNISGRNYTFSFYAKNCTLGDKAILGGANVDDQTINMGDGNEWAYYSVNYNFPLGLSDNHVFFSIISNSCQVDRLKLEMSGVGTQYSNYRDNSLIYQKLIPDYLASECYVNSNPASPDYRLKPNASNKCSGYARRCNASEVDCDLYKSVRDDFVLPARVTPNDSCFAECDGYDSYIKKATAFANPELSNFIPNSATKCGANAVGCTEFTNLDSVAKGGEGKEYYSFLRQCIKPDNNVCGVFYSWGSSSSGYQLQPSKLKASADKPELTAGTFDANRNHVLDGAVVCSEAIFNSAPSSSAYNSDCRQFYNKDGVIFYALYSKTITCSNDCHPYRLSETPIDESITSAAACTGADKNWDASSTACMVCKNGGVWDNTQSACIYQAIPGEGRSCASTENGCREYNGNHGNTSRIINSYDFESSQVWGSYCNDASSLSSDSINKNGHSLNYNYNGGSCGTNNFNLAPVVVSSRHSDPSLLAVIKNFWSRVIKGAEAQSNNALPSHGIGITVGKTVNQNSAYVLRFLAKATSNVSINAYLANGTVASQFNVNAQNNGSVSISGNNEWKMYTVNLAALDHEVTDQEALIISASGGLLLDDITLTEVTDRFYLIKDSWVTPDSCYYDTANQYQGVNYNLGCGAYTNRANATSYLRNFSHLCSDSSAGCELMALTNNSSDPGVQTFNESGTANNQCDGSDGPSCVQVPADKMAYVIYDTTKQCGSENKGCSRLGQQTVTNQDVTVQNLYADTYIKNNPDKYDTILCSDNEVGCDEWKYLDGQSSYFKDPGDNVCEWRRPVNATGMNLPQKWYKRAIKRCDFDNNGKINIDVNGNITESQNKLCNSDTDCNYKPCILDKNDYLCEVDSLKTIGLGGGNLVYQPKTMVGVCEAKASGCTEYVDPVSEFSPNNIVNPGWGDINKDGIKGDGWSTSTFQTVPMQKQTVYLLKNKLYSLSAVASGATQDTILSCPASVRVLQADNSFAAPTNTITIDNVVANKNVLFNSLNNVACTIYGGENNKTISLRGTIVDYKLLTGVDKTTCNGAASFDSGCILFNERKQNGSSGLSAMTWNAYGGSYNSASPITPTNLADADSNVLIKVKPNRVCSKWLSCMSMGIDSTTGEEVCYALGECDKLNDFGRCQSFVTKPEIQHTFDSGSDRNITGYSKMNNYYLSNMSEVGEDLSGNPNGGSWGFESTSTPGFTINNYNKAITDFSVIVGAIDYPAVGKGVALIGGNASTTPSNQIASLSFAVTNKDREHFVNFLVNIDASEGGKLEVSGTGWSASTIIDSGTGWQRRVLRFVPTSNGNAVIKLYSSSNSAPTYFDDINIEPVLKVADNSYVAKECRLYPKQDSLSCKSDNQSVTANGIYGYCLEHDPKNQNVCIMWYPIDNVKSSQASAGTFSGFNGYNGVTNPYYCAQITPNYQFLEKRSAYLLTSQNSDNGCTYWAGFPVLNQCPAGYKTFFMRWQHHEGNNAKCTTDYFCIPEGAGSDVVRVCDPNSESANPGDPAGCSSVNGPYPQTYGPFSYLDGSTAFVSGSSFGGGNGGYDAWIEVSGNGYYIYNGTQSHDSLIGTKLLDYDDNTVKDTNGFVPKCTKFVKGSTPWVKRLSDDVVPQFFNVNPYSSLRLGFNIQPFGSTDLSTTNPGFPYSCYPAGGLTNNGAELCKTVNVAANGTISVSYQGTGPYINGTTATSANYLRQIFLKGESASSGFSYNCLLGTNCPTITPCSGNTRPNNSPTTGYCSVYPDVIDSSIKLRDSEGHLIPYNNGYAISTPGYYTLSFGVSVDPEQLPVSQLLIDFDDGTNAEATQIDPSNNYNFIHYFNPQTGQTSYHIRIKVKDNWETFGWSGLPTSGGCNAILCTKNNFSSNLVGPGQACQNCLQ